VSCLATDLTVYAPQNVLDKLTNPECFICFHSSAVNPGELSVSESVLGGKE